MREIAFTIFGQAYSKANSRQLVMRGNKPSNIKSPEALAYECSALKQIPPIFRLQLTGEMCISLWMYYETERPDMDESLVLDCLQDRYESESLTKAQKEVLKAAGKKPKRILVQKGVVVNDRQFRERHVYHGIDKANPRVELIIEPRMPQQVELQLPVAVPTRVFDPLDV
jgi:hypothetical protein